MQASSTHPLLVLNEIDSACKTIIANAASPEKPFANKWSGVGFQIAKDALLIESQYVHEICNCHFNQSLSSVPGAKPWLLGLTSLRGQPLSVIDLKQYLLNQASSLTANNRLIVIKHDNYLAGLLVEHIYGLKQFDRNRATDSARGNSSVFFSAKVRDLIDGVFDEGDIKWGKMVISKLVSDQDFANAAH